MNPSLPHKSAEIGQPVDARPLYNNSLYSRVFTAFTSVYLSPHGVTAFDNKPTETMC